MFNHCQLVVLILSLTLDGQAQAVIGSHESVPHSRPYMVLLESLVDGKRAMYCAGFLLNEDFVMSAASCKVKSPTVLLGVHDVHNSRTMQRIQVDQTFVHEDYDKTFYNNDVMLLKLSSKVQFNKNVRPIRLACRDSSSVPKSCIVSGWGTTMKNGYMSTKLMEVNVTLINSPECGQENSYCSEGEAGPNRGDGGGPLVCEDGKAYGVVSSFLPTNSGGPLIHTYTKIPDKRAWITSTICNALF